MLETGVSTARKQSVSMSGPAFRRRGPYGDYAEDALTVYMEKELA